MLFYSDLSFRHEYLLASTLDVRPYRFKSLTNELTLANGISAATHCHGWVWPISSQPHRLATAMVSRCPTIDRGGFVWLWLGFYPICRNSFSIERLWLWSLRRPWISSGRRFARIPDWSAPLRGQFCASKSTANQLSTVNSIDGDGNRSYLFTDFRVLNQLHLAFSVIWLPFDRQKFNWMIDCNRLKPRKSIRI